MPKMLVVRVPTGQAEGACRIDDRPCDYRIEGDTFHLRHHDDPEVWQSWTIYDAGSEPEALRREGSTLLRLRDRSPMPT